MLDESCVFWASCIDGIDECKCRHYRPITNADKVRSMSDEELAKLLGGLSARAYDWVDSTEEEVKKWLEWLHKEAEE